MQSVSDNDVLMLHNLLNTVLIMRNKGSVDLLLHHWKMKLMMHNHWKWGTVYSITLVLWHPFLASLSGNLIEPLLTVPHLIPESNVYQGSPYLPLPWLLNSFFLQFSYLSGDFQHTSPASPLLGGSSLTHLPFYWAHRHDNLIEMTGSTCSQLNT